MPKKVLLFTTFLSVVSMLLCEPKTRAADGGPRSLLQDVLVFSTTSVPDGIYGTAYAPDPLAVTGGTAPYTFSVTGGGLPAGMNLSTDGILSGTPTAAGSFSFTVTATDAALPQNSGTQDYTLVVSPATLTITPNNTNKAYGAALPVLGVSYSGFVNGDNPASLSAPPTVSTTATAGSPVGPYSITAIGAVDANYTISYNPGTLTVDPVPLTITAVDASMIYGGVVPAFSVTYSGFVNGDGAGNLGTPPTVSSTAGSAPAAGSYPITPGGAADANYTISYVAGTLTVGKAALTVTANNQTMPLGGPLPAFTVGYSGFVNGDGPASLGTPASATSAATASSGAGTYPIVPAGGVSTNYTFTYVNGTLTVNKGTLIITASPAGSVYGTALVPDASLAVTYTGFVNGDGPASLTTPATVANSAVAGSPAGSYVLTPSGATSPNYTISFVNGTYTISQAALTITAANQTMIYGGVVPALTATYTGFVNGDGPGNLTTQPTITTTATSASAVGGYPITATGAASPNYAITYVAGTMAVGKATLTVTANNQTMPLGGPLPALTVSYSGFVNGDVATSLGTQPTATTTATAGSGAGTYPIVPAGGVSTNYNFVYVNGVLSVGKAVLTITANPANSVYGAALVPNSSLTVSYSGFVNGDGPGSLTTQPTVANSAVAGSPAGSYVVTPSGASSPNYTINYVNGVYTISKAALSITAVNQSKTYGGPVPALTVTYSGFVNGDGAANLTSPPTVTTTATAASPVGSYPITAAGAVSSNYTFSYTAGVMTVGKATLTVTANNQTMPLGGPLPALTVSYSGFVNGDGPASLGTQPTATTTATAGSGAGTYTIVPAGGVSTNYNFVYVNGVLSVGKAVLTITASPAGSVYGAALVPNSSLTVTYNGFVNGDGPGSLTTLPTVANSAFTGSPAGNYVLTPSGATSPNYTIVFVNGIYTISPASLSITAVNQTMVYGGAVPTLTATYIGFVNGDGAGNLTTQPTITSTATSASAAGSYPITATGAVDPNYTISYVAGTMTVGKAMLTVTANNQTMPLGGPLPALTLSYSGFVNGNGPGNLTTQPLASTTAVVSSGAGTYPIAVSGGVSGNYDFTYVNGLLSVGKATLTISANTAGSVYGAPIVTATVSYSGFVNGDGPASLTLQPIVTNSAFGGAPAGAYILTPSGAQSDNYNIVYVNGAYTISPAPLNISAANQTMVYGGVVPALTATYSGFVNGDGPGNLTTAPTLSTTATPASPAGNYPISVAGAVSPNYSISFTAGTMTVGKAALTVTADSKSMPLGGPLPVLTISYSGFVNGDNAASLSTQPVASTTATTGSPAGAYPITVAGAASPNYSFTYVTGILAVGKALLTITANPSGSVYGAPLVAGSSLTVSYTGFVNGDGPANLTQQPTVINSAFTGAPVGNYALIPSGAQSDNYVINYVNGIYSISPAPLNISAVNQTMTYGSTVPSLSATYNGFVNGDDVTRLTTPPTVTTSASPASPVGTYPILASGAASPNYTITYTPGTMTVTGTVLTITPNPATMVYGSPVPLLTASYSGFVNGDNPTRLATPPTITTTATSGSPTGTYTITAAGAASPNYSILYNTGTLTINPASLQVTANAQTKKFGTPDPVFTYTVSGLLNSDNLSIFTGSLSRAAGENVGSYPITQGSLSAGSNYTLSYAGNNLIITIASQQIVWEQTLTVGCNDQTQVQLLATASSGLPVSYTIADPSIGTISGSVLTLLKPGSTLLTATQAGDANHSAATPITDTVHYQAASLIRQRWNDVIFFDNSSGNYVQWQWYKNGDAVAGAVNPYYSETPTLNGQYYVIATNKDSQRIQSCVLSIAANAPIPGGIKVYPNPVAASALATVTSNYASTALQGAIMQIVDLTGRVRQVITNVQPTMQVTMPAETGTYIINLMFPSGQKASINVLVVQ